MTTGNFCKNSLYPLAIMLTFIEMYYTYLYWALLEYILDCYPKQHTVPIRWSVLLFDLKCMSNSNNLHVYWVHQGTPTSINVSIIASGCSELLQNFPVVNLYNSLCFYLSQNWDFPSFLGSSNFSIGFSFEWFSEFSFKFFIEFSFCLLKMWS